MSKEGEFRIRVWLGDEKEVIILLARIFNDYDSYTVCCKAYWKEVEDHGQQVY